MTPEQFVGGLLIAFIIGIVDIAVAVQGWEESLKQAALVAVILALSFGVAKLLF